MSAEQNRVVKKDLARTLSAANPKLFPTIAVAEAAIDSIFDGISTELAKGISVRITGFADFEVATTAARRGRNPRTGEELMIPSYKRVAFTALKQLKERVRS